MGLNPSILKAMSVFEPSSLHAFSLIFFEFLKFDSKHLRDENIVSKEDLQNSISQSTKIKNIKKLKKTELSKELEDFFKKLDRSLFVKNSPEELSDIKWDRIDEFCTLLRLIERSDERKVRWALYHLFNSGKTTIRRDEILNLLKVYNIKNLDKLLSKIIKNETYSGLNASYDGKIFSINHEKKDKLVQHYLADAIEEKSRRSPGELEDEVLKLLDEGSYSNQEVSQALNVDEALVSRTVGKLRDHDKIILSSFGQRGARYFTTNCDNCPFGTTKASCRKEALSFIIKSFAEDFGMDLNSTDFDSIEANQAILKIKRFVMHARKEKNTKLEKNLSENLSKLLSRVVDKYLELEIPEKKTLNIPEIKVQVNPGIVKLPLLYQLGLQKGAQGGIHLMDEILHLASKSVKKEDRIKIKKHALQETNKFLKNLGLNLPKMD